MPLRWRKPFENSGQALAEYALILALASLGIVSALLILQRSLENTMLGSGRQIDAAATGSAGQALPGELVGGGSGETARIGSGTAVNEDGDGKGSEGAGNAAE